MDKRKAFLEKTQGLFALSILPLVIGIVGLIIHSNYSRLAKTPEPPLPPWKAADFPAVYGNTDPGIPAYLVHCDRSSMLRVSFDARKSIKGWWAGSGAELSILSPYAESFPATTNSDIWGVIILSQDVDEFTPWLEVTLKVDPKYYHTWLTADAKLQIEYPKSAGSTFTNYDESLAQRVQLLVITDEDLEMQKTRDRWEEAVDNSSPVSLIISLVLLFLGSLALSGGFVNLACYRKAKERENLI